MTPAINLTGVQTACGKLGCDSGSPRLHRHHTGCQYMFVRHLRRHLKGPRFDEFEARYHRFEPADIVVLCDVCHFELHGLYLPIIGNAVRRDGRIRRWSWKQAYALMDELDKYCRAWIKVARTIPPNCTAQLATKRKR